MSAPVRLGRYPVRERLGAGAFATVWLAHDEHLDSPVAVKVLADNWAGDLHVRRRFVEEGRFLRKVESPHVVPVYDAGELEDGRPYLVMAYADRGTLTDRLEAGDLAPGESVEIVCHIGAGLTALHERGVLHRDVKPGNILFRTVPGHGLEEVVAMLGDLGLGKSMDMSSRLTMIGGTPSYVAPEQARGEGLDPRADQFSLAALTYLLLAGRPPYAHQSLGAAAEPGPPQAMGTVARAVEEVVLRGLAADRDERFADVASYTAALLAAWAAFEELHVDPSSDDRPGEDAGAPSEPVGEAATALLGRPGPAPTHHPRRRRRGWWVAGGVVALLVGGVAGALVQPALAGEVTRFDDTGTISVRIPTSWTASLQTGAWKPPGAPTDHPGIAAGTAAGWQAVDTAAPGVFAGLMAGNRMPTQVPQHPECDDVRAPVDVQRDGDTSRTVISTGCPGADVIVERVVQVSEGQLLWVQVRSDDQATATTVLDGVELHGF